MQASGGRYRGSARLTVATALLALWTTTNQFHAGHSLSSGLACPLESIGCVADPDCSTCLDSLQVTLASTNISPATCEDLYADVCVIAVEAGCDPTNQALLDLASCVAEDTFGCSDFTSCAEAVSATPMPTTAALTTPVPTTAALTTPVPTTAARNTVEPSPAITVGPSGAPTAVPTTPDTAAPSPFIDATTAPTSNGTDLVTTSPSSADGSRDLDPGTPSPTSTSVEPGEEAATDSGNTGWRSIAAVTVITRVSIATAIVFAL